MSFHTPECIEAQFAMMRAPLMRNRLPLLCACGCMVEFGERFWAYDEVTGEGVIRHAQDRCANLRAARRDGGGSA